MTTHEKAMSAIPVEIIDRYDTILRRYSAYSKCDPDPGTSIPHLRWMLSELCKPMPYGKANRWLGFIQGSMIARGMITVQEERDFTRPLFQGEATALTSLAARVEALEAEREADKARIAGLEAGDLDDVGKLFLAARVEADRAMRKFPQPNYVITKVAEEAGEVVKAAIHCAEGRELPSAVADEIKQAMAMLIRLYVEGDQVHGLAPIAGRALLKGERKG